MNHLAHVVLAGPDEGFRLGAFLGDHVKGLQALEKLPSSWAAGVRLHRHIDSFCDSHPAVAELLENLQPPWRRYGGIIFDVLFDLMLTRHWDRFGPTGLDHMNQQISRMLARHEAELPPRLVRFSRWASRRRLWLRLGQRDMLNEIFVLLARRHGRSWPLARGLSLLDAHDAAIEAAFLCLFPDLMESVRRERVRLYSTLSMM